MAAVLTLVMLPLIASVGFMLKVGSVPVFLVFLIMACGIVIGLSRLMYRWEDEEA